MRQGPDYGMWINRSEKLPHPYLHIPLELEDDWSRYSIVDWRDNGDGTYTLTPRKICYD